MSMNKQLLKTKICVILADLLRRSYESALSDMYEELGSRIKPKVMIEEAAVKIMKLIEECNNG